ncbi:putative transporter [Campylobacter sp. MIT 12-5580]|uniref:putative transporter n=1 Tax=Campylobacter sp. MIT 12-5580 TaxID=2040651 RepID=UPI0010F70361|nr:putative transporter [Campylobacter sp. MIT 12-5580]TKX30387.1 putative transporter [Campylobacter sp. MIT 12-5580]
MFSAFFASKKWALWAYLGLFFLLFCLYIQTNLNVAINEWYKDFYNVLQKPQIKPLEQTSTKDEATTSTQNTQANHSSTQDTTKDEKSKEQNTSKQDEQKTKQNENDDNTTFLNALAMKYYKSLTKSHFGENGVDKQSYIIEDFYALIVIFLFIAIPYVLVATINIYFASVYAFKWREAMTFEYLRFWKNKDDNIEGSSQRIQEDIYNFSKIVESLGLAFVRAVMILIAFIPILWALSASVNVPILRDIEGSLVYVAFLISVGGLIISWFVGIKLPGLEYNNQKAEAAFRKELVYAEDDRKNYAKNETMLELFTGLKFNYKRLFLHYGYFNIWLILFEQMIVIVPLLIMAPSLFIGAIGLGIVMQMNNAFDQVRSSFSVFITNWTKITELRSIYKRLKEFEKNIAYKKH